MEEGTAKPLKAYVFSCPNCGSPMHYDIGEGEMICDSCGTTKPVQEFEDPSLKEQTGEMDTVEFVCPKCGASIHTADGAASGYCSHCGSEVVLNARMTRMRRPDMIAPFRITREQCEKYYRSHLENYRFAPKDLKDQQTISHFQPIYIPFWNYTFTAKGDTKGSGERSYSDSEYKYINELSIDVNAEVKLSSVLYDASSAFEDETALKLSFFPLSMQTREFHPAYLCGVYTQAPDVTDDIYRLGMEPLAQEKFTKAFEGKTGASGDCVLPPERETTAELVLMPVWLLTSRRGDRVLYTAINGYDGKVICEPPVNGRRFTLLTFALFCLLLAAFWFTKDFIILRPNLVLGACGIISAVGMKHIVPRLDDILTRRQHDIDPTRNMKRLNPEQDVSLPKEEPRRSKISAFLSKIKKILYRLVSLYSRSAIIRFLLIIPGFYIFYNILMDVTIIFFGVLYNLEFFINSLISDRGILVPAVMIAVLIMLIRVRYTYHKAPVDAGRQKSPRIFIAMLIILRLLAVCGIVITAYPIPAVGLWCYGLSISMLILLVVNLILTNRLNNEFVTRPVPILGKEAES